MFSEHHGVDDSSMAANLPTDANVIAPAQSAHGLIP